MSGNVMSRLLLIPVLVLVVSISGLALGDSEHEKSLRLVQEGKILPLQQILNQVISEQSGRVLEVELERERGRYVYEIELLAEDGRVWEYQIDAASGKVLERELED